MRRALHIADRTARLRRKNAYRRRHQALNKLPKRTVETARFVHQISRRRNLPARRGESHRHLSDGNGYSRSRLLRLENRWKRAVFQSATGYGHQCEPNRCPHSAVNGLPDRVNGNHPANVQRTLQHKVTVDTGKLREMRITIQRIHERQRNSNSWPPRLYPPSPMRQEVGHAAAPEGQLLTGPIGTHHQSQITLEFEGHQRFRK